MVPCGARGPVRHVSADGAVRWAFDLHRLSKVALVVGPGTVKLSVEGVDRGDLVGRECEVEERDGRAEESMTRSSVVSLASLIVERPKDDLAVRACAQERKPISGEHN
jgi:hypothetical protein